MVHGINGNSGNDALKYLNALNKTKQTGGTAETKNISAQNTISFQKTVDNTTDLSKTMESLSGKARTNAPAAQGLASAKDIENGKLVSGYTFDNINSLGGSYDAKLFEIKYNNADAVRVANGTKQASDGVEYATVAAHLQDKNSPFAELFA